MDDVRASRTRTVRLAVVLLTFLALLGIASTASAQLAGLFSCSTSDEGHERWALKQRKIPSALASAKKVTIADILDWKIPAGHKDSEEEAIPPREPKLYTVTGFVRKVKLSDDDCDFHLELATSGTSKGDWIIVELSASAKALQKKLAGMFNLSDAVHSHIYNGPKAKKVIATGYAFLDLSHQCKKWPTKGCQHGGENVMTIWEIHPVVSVAWAQ